MNQKVFNFSVPLLILVFALLSLSSCASRKNKDGMDWFPETDSRSAAARGKIIIYTSMYEEVFRGIERKLNSRFHDFDVQFVYGGTAQIQARIEREIASGRLGCDIIMVAEPSYSIELKRKGVLHSYRSPEASNLAFEYDSEGYWYPVRVSNMVLAFNPQRFARNSVPRSFYEFAYDAAARNVVSMSNPLTSGTAMAAVNALWEKYSAVYFEALGRQGVMIDSGSVAIAKLENGECRAAMVLEESVLKKRQEENSPLEVIYPADGTVVIPSTIMIVSDRFSANMNAAAAQRVTDWFLSEEGQHEIVSGWMHSVRIGFDRYPHDSIPTSEITANSMPVNWENIYSYRNEIQERFEEYITNRR